MYALKRRILIFSVCILIGVFCHAQQYNFKNYTAKNGLGSSIVNNIFQDSQGYIWFATQGGGVSRFDGAVFKNFTKDDGLISNNITVITEDKKGNIWIGTAEGVSKFNGSVFTNFNEKQGLPQAIVYSVFVDDKNKIWMGFRDGGIRIFDGIKLDSLTVNNGLPHNRIFSIKQDKSGHYWINTRAGIVKYDGSEITNFNQEEILKNKFFFSMLIDNEENIWFGGAGCGVVKYNGTSFENIELPAAISADVIGGLTQDKSGNLWLATGHGIVKYGNKKFTVFSERQGLSLNEVLAITCDYEGNIWAGTNGGGVNYFNNEAFVSYVEKDGLTGNMANCIVADPVDNTYYIGTSGKGLLVFKPNSEGKFSQISGIKELNDVTIFSLNFDHNGLLWVGTEKGVFVLENKNNSFRLYKSYTQAQDQDLVNVLKVISDKKGNHWFASYGSGLIHVSGNQEKYIGVEAGLATMNIMTVYEDVNSVIWIGTLDDGVYKYDGKNFNRFLPKGGFPDKAVWAITGDEKGNIFFGTGENGLCCYDGKKLVIHTDKHGISSNYINALEWDKNENCLWVGSEKGTNRVTFKNDFEIQSKRTFREQEGFSAFEINQNAILADNDLVWFGSVNGLCSYDKKLDIPNTTPPKIQLTGIRLGYKTVDWKNYADSVNPQNNLPVNLKLNYKNNHLVFDFQALTTDDIEYTFMLEGQDDEWSPFAKNTEANYSNITPGKQYTFKVKARNSNGILSNETVAFTFFINPPWWTTWWFRISVFIAVIILIAAFIKTRERVLKEQNLKLEKTVTERTAEVVHQKVIVEEKNKQITDSIEYAKRIQTAILPPDRLVKQYLNNSFVLYLPKDIVAGDFYWMEIIQLADATISKLANANNQLINTSANQLILFAACDCTGHGVPGAMVSVMCHNALNRTVREYQLTEPAKILDKVVDLVEDNFTKSEDEIQDGMDASLCAYYPEQQRLQWAGANNPLWIIRNNEIIEYKPDKQPIGKYEYRKPYTNHEIKLQQGDTIYIFSDGYHDQFGDNGEKKLTKKGLKQILLSIQHLTMEQQREELVKLHNQWKGQVEQIDDICVIGVRV